MKEIVDNLLHKPAFGFEGYNPKPTHKDLIASTSHKQPKQKRTTFAEEIGIQKGFVPPSTKYQTELDWAKNPSTRTGKFFTTKRYTIAGEIEKRSKKPEKTSPGPVAYQFEDAKDRVLSRSPSAVKQLEQRITFTHEREWFAQQTPGYSHTKVEPVSLDTRNNLQGFALLIKEEKPRVQMIHKGGDRFEKEKELSPSPTSYNTLSSFQFTASPRGKLILGKDKRVSFVDSLPKMNISPGPAKHSFEPKVLNKLTMSPSLSRKRI